MATALHSRNKVRTNRKSFSRNPFSHLSDCVLSVFVDSSHKHRNTVKYLFYCLLWSTQSKALAKSINYWLFISCENSLPFHYL